VQERLGDVLGSAPGEPESDDEAFEQVRERVQALISAARTLSDTCADLADALRPVPGMVPDDPIVAGFGRLRAERTAALLDEAASAARGTLGLLYSAYGALDDRRPRVRPPGPTPSSGTWPEAFVEVPSRAFTVDDEAGTAVAQRPWARPESASPDATDPHGIAAAATDEQTAIAAPDAAETTGEPIGTRAEEARPEPVEVVRESATSTTRESDDSVGGPGAVPDEATGDVTATSAASADTVAGASTMRDATDVVGGTETTAEPLADGTGTGTSEPATLSTTTGMPADGLAAGEDDSDAAGRDLDWAIGAAADALGRIANDAGPTKDVGDVAADAGMPAKDTPGRAADAEGPAEDRIDRAADAGMPAEDTSGRTADAEVPAEDTPGRGADAEGPAEGAADRGIDEVSPGPPMDATALGVDELDRGPDDLDGDGLRAWASPARGWRDSILPAVPTADDIETNESTADETTADGTVTADSRADESTAAGSAVATSAADETSADDLQTARSTVDETAADGAVTDESTAAETTGTGTTGTESTADGTVTAASTADESTADESTADESTADESTTDESTTDESTTDETTADGDRAEEAGTVGEHTRDDIEIQPRITELPPPEDEHTPDDVDGEGLRGWATAAQPVARPEVAAAALAGWIVVDPDDADDHGHPIPERAVAAAPSVDRLTIPVLDPAVTADAGHRPVTADAADRADTADTGEPRYPGDPGDSGDTRDLGDTPSREDMADTTRTAPDRDPAQDPAQDLARDPLADLLSLRAPDLMTGPMLDPITDPVTVPAADPDGPGWHGDPVSAEPRSLSLVPPFPEEPDLEQTGPWPAAGEWAGGDLSGAATFAPAQHAVRDEHAIDAADHPAWGTAEPVFPIAGRGAAPEKPLDEPAAAVLARQVEAARRHLQAALVVASGPAAPRQLGGLLTAIEQVLTAVTDLARETRGLLESGLGERTFPGEARFLCSTPWEGTNLVGRDAYGDDAATPGGLAKLLRALGYEAHSVTSAGGMAGVQIRSPRYSMQVALVEPAGGGRQRWSGALEWVDESGVNRTWAEMLGPAELEDEELARRVDELLRRSVGG